MQQIKRVEQKEEKSDNIRVVVRTRPTPNFATKNLSLDTVENMITINVPKTEDKGLINSQKENWTFKFDKILHNVSQDELFEYSTKEIIQKATEGFNGTIFAYGQTGSGKTFTMSGTPSNYSYRGIIPRAITRVFQEIGNKPEVEFQIKVSYLEIYNETFFDLLSPIPTHQQKGEISIQEDSKGNMIMKGLSIMTVNNEEEAFNHLFEGEANKTISVHHLNKESSRSHCIFTVHLEMKSKIESSEKVITSKLNFVDLAGSERVKKTGSTGVTLKEANYINKSLTFLEQVVISLSERSKMKKHKQPSSKILNGDHIPYRQSKLTHILKDSIGGNCNTVMIATIIPEENQIQETLSSLNFAKKMMSVENEVSVNIQLDVYKQLKNYAREIKELKQELAMHNTLSNRGRVNYDPYTQDEIYQQQQIAHRFLTGKDENIEFESVRQAKELFNQCRMLYQKIWDSNKDSTPMSIHDDKQKTKQASITKDNFKSESEEGKGDLEAKSSFGIGKANRDARPINKLEVSQNNPMHTDCEEDETFRKKGTIHSGKFRVHQSEILTKHQEEAKVAESEDIPDKNTAFATFKLESKKAKDIENYINIKSKELNQKKEQARQYMELCNNLKSVINDFKMKLEDKKNYKFNLGDDMANIIDEEEYNYCNKLKATKDEYKENLNHYKELKSDINQIKSSIDLEKVSLVESFEGWFLKKYGIKIEDYELKLNKGKFGVRHEIEGENDRVLDIEEQAYFNAKHKVASLSRARKLEKIKIK